MGAETIKEYFYQQEKYEKEYGIDKTVVFIQIGSFYEVYSYDERGADLAKLSNLLDIALTRKNKGKKVSESNPRMMGVPVSSIDKHIRTLMKNGYTVPVIDQDENDPSRRRVNNIYSPGIYIDDVSVADSKNIMCIYIEDEYQLVDKSFIMCIGISVIDVGTGKSVLYEVISRKNDKNLACDEAVRFIHTYNPKEIIVYRKKQDKNTDMEKLQSKEDVINYLELNGMNYSYSESIPKKMLTIKYQELYLKKLFTNTGMYDTAIEYLDLEKRMYCLKSFVLILEFVYSHNPSLLEKIRRPEMFIEDTHLILGNNAINQLNILKSDISADTSSRFKSLIDVVDNSNTNMGKRFLKDRLCNPITDHKQLTKSFETVEFIKNGKIDEIKSLIKGVVDIERLSRKICSKKIHPFELYEFIVSYEKIDKLFNRLSKMKELKYLIKKETVSSMKQFIKYTNSVFDKKNLHCYKISDLKDVNKIEYSLFKKGQFKDIDTVYDKIKNGRNLLEEMCVVLSMYIRDKNKKSTDTKTKISVNHNRRDGYFMKTTNNRVEILKNRLKNVKSVKITDDYSLDPQNLKFKNLQGKSNEAKIFCDDFDNLDTDNNVEEFSRLSVDKYNDIMEHIRSIYTETFNDVSDTVAQIDFYLSSAVTAEKYNYCKPVIRHDKNKGFINTEKLRHPIIERIIGSEYVPHDISLGFNDLDGMLIFGLNSAGKSSLMKAVGLAVVMAQSGMFVPATDFMFSPFSSLFARITGNDNIFKGLSSFALEMVELDAILKRASPKTLIIGDEVCRGTESVSGNSLVASTILRLSHKRSPFMFATHLHDVPKIKQIKELNNVKSYHLTVDIDEKTGKLMFDRKLKEGSGETVYGITVAKYFIEDNDFIKEAEKIRKSIIKQPTTYIADKTSRYNAKIVMDCCQVCGKTSSDDDIPLDTHHINFQKDCDEKFVKSKPHIGKNSEQNLVVLCKKCHQNVHNKKIIINRKIKTSHGIEIQVTQK